MAPLTNVEEKILTQKVSSQLSKTPYACSALTKLNALDVDANVSNTVIVKASTEFVAINRDFPLDISRCLFESSILQALIGFPRTVATLKGFVKVAVPKVYYCLTDQQPYTQILQDFTGTVDLTTILESPSVGLSLPASSPTSIGYAMGSWLRMFHTWTSEPAQGVLLSDAGANEGMRKLKCLITYDSFIEILERHPEVIEDHLDTLKEIQMIMRHEFECSPIEEGAERCLIHSDFWGGNILLADGPWRKSDDPDRPSALYIIDWENVQYSHRAVDIGGILADLYERNHFKDVQASITIIKGFIEGYGKLSEELAYRVAIHAGVHLICWYYRRDRNAPLPYPLPKVLAALTLGRDLILKGWAKDRSWLKMSILASMFADQNLI
ncbi:kinase-like domain-containing protein [Xylariaceae sp. FL0255]|nr:kinase-like domain-containing protein [Xylariaceae sp. FL0255]